jgi:hypothetical protein
VQEDNGLLRKKIQELKRKDLKNKQYLTAELNDHVEIISQKYVSLMAKYE